MTDLNHLIVIYLAKDKKELVSEQKILSLMESQQIECKIILSQLLESNFFIMVIIADKKPFLSELSLSKNEFLSFEDNHKKIISPICHQGNELNYPFYYLIKNEPILETLEMLIKTIEGGDINIIDIRLVEDLKTPSFAFFQSAVELNLDAKSIIEKVEKDIQVTF